MQRLVPWFFRRVSFPAVVLFGMGMALLSLTLACGGGNNASTSVPQAVITSFTAAATPITTGTATTLTAIFANGTGNIDHGIGAVTSGTPVSTGNLADSTTFILTVTGAGGPITKTCVVDVAAQPKPVITSFTAAATPITTGTATTLTAIFANGTGNIDHGIGAVTSGTPVSTRNLTASTTFNLSVTGPGGTITKTCVVDVAAQPKPVITSFAAAATPITTGTATTLTAIFANGTGNIDHGIGAVTSGTPVSTGNLTASTTFNLSVTGPGGTITQTCVVAVSAPSPSFHVVYNGNGATHGSVPDDATSYLQNQPVQIRGNTGGLAKVGSHFSGWNTAANGTGTTYSPGQMIAMGAHDMLLFAKWSADTNLGNNLVGINLDGINYWSPGWMFVDLVKHFAGDWGEGGGKHGVDANGWVNSLETGGVVGNGVISVGDGRSPSNTWVLKWTGVGTLRLSGSSNPTIQTPAEPNRVVFSLGNPAGGLSLSISMIDAANYPRNIAIVPIEYEATYLTQPFHPAFLESLNPFSGIRFMNAMQTNNSRQSFWENRPKVTDAVQGTQTDAKGVALEYLIQLANQLHANPWFNIPHKADDTYVRNFALMVKEQLDPTLKAYVEYSNEIWNFTRRDISQGDYCAKRGHELKLDGPDQTDTSASLHYQGYRSCQIFDIFDEVFGSEARTRYVRVIAGQSVFYGRNKFILDFELPDHSKVYEHADAFAVAPYFGDDLRSLTSLTVPNVLSYLAGTAVPACINDMAANKQIAADRTLALVGYEGGQHLVAAGDPPTESAIKTLWDVNRDPLMKDFYLQYLNGWKSVAPGAMFLYEDTFKYGRWGYWGLLEYQKQPRKEAPKYDAALTFIEAN